MKWFSELDIVKKFKEEDLKRRLESIFRDAELRDPRSLDLFIQDLLEYGDELTRASIAYGHIYKMGNNGAILYHHIPLDSSIYDQVIVANNGDGVQQSRYLLDGNLYKYGHLAFF